MKNVGFQIKKRLFHPYMEPIYFLLIFISMMLMVISGNTFLEENPMYALSIGAIVMFMLIGLGSKTNKESEYKVKMTHPLYSNLHDIEKTLMRFRKHVISHNDIKWTPRMIDLAEPENDIDLYFNLIYKSLSNTDMVWLLNELFKKPDVQTLLIKIAQMNKDKDVIRLFNEKPLSEREAFLEPLLKDLDYIETFRNSETFMYKEIINLNHTPKSLIHKIQKENKLHKLMGENPKLEIETEEKTYEL